MEDFIEVVSEKKGSNPGGKCHVHCDDRRFYGYFKFCYGSKIHHGMSAFKANHQPIYEAITFGLVRKLGLSTTDFYILLNR